MILVATSNQAVNNSLSFPIQASDRQTANHSWKKYGNMTKVIFKAATRFNVPVFPPGSVINFRCQKEMLVAWD